MYNLLWLKLNSNCEDEPSWTCDTCGGGGYCDNIDACDGTYKYCKSYNKEDDGTSGSSSSGKSESSSSSNNSSNDNESEIWESAGFIAGMCVLALMIVVVGISCFVYKKRKMNNQVSYTNKEDYVPPTNDAAQKTMDDVDQENNVRVY